MTTMQCNYFQVSNLTTGQEYVFRIMAENRFGLSDALITDSVTVKYPFTVPDRPGKPAFVKSTHDSIMIEWNHPETNGGMYKY